MRALGQHMELGIRLTFDDQLDADLLARAVRLSLDAEPVLGCSLRTSTMHGWWQRREDLDDGVPFSLLQTTDADADAARLLVGPIPDEGPQVMVTLLRSPDRDDVVIGMSHNVADGQSVKQYAYVLADLYTRLVADPSFVPDPNLAPRPRAQEVWDSLSDAQRHQAAREPRMTMPNWVFPRTSSTGRGRTLRELRPGPERLAAVRLHGKLLGATVNDMMLTAFFRALTRTFPQPVGKPLSLSFSAEHRRYLTAAEEPPISNLAVTIWMGVENREGEAFDGTLERVVGQTSLWRESLWGLRSGVRTAGLIRIGYEPMRMILSAIGRLSAGSGKSSPVFTNIGVIDERRLAFGADVPVDARMSGPSGFGASFVATISTYRDTLTVSMGFCEADMDASAVESVLRAIDEELTAF
jgi:NRPS condensation-like uncharacterized protein